MVSYGHTFWLAGCMISLLSFAVPSVEAQTPQPFTLSPMRLADAIAVDATNVNVVYYADTGIVPGTVAKVLFATFPIFPSCVHIPCLFVPPTPFAIAEVQLNPRFIFPQHLSIAVDSQGTGHVLFQDFQTGLKYAKSANNGWTIETIDPSATALYNSIAIDANGNPHVAYCCSVPGNSINYATKVAGQWVITQGVGSGENLSNLSIAVDSGGSPHIAFAVHYFPANYVGYISKGNGSWANGDIVLDGTIFGLSLAIDSTDTPHLAYWGWNTSNDLSGFVGYATRSVGPGGPFWTSEGVDSFNIPCCLSNPFDYNMVSLGLNPHGDPRISYGSDAGVKLARRDAGPWTTQILDSSPTAANAYTTLAADTHGYSHVLIRAAGATFDSNLLEYIPVATFNADLNGDGVVDCKDLAIVKASFGKDAGDTGFDPRADINFDGVVNILDLAYISRKIPAATVCR